MRKVVAAVALLGLAACGDAGAAPGSEPISRAEFGPGWPLTVDAGELRCEGQEGVRLATFVTGGEEYALNARARGQREGADLEPIWAPDPDRPGKNRELGPLIDRALELCVEPSPRPTPADPPFGPPRTSTTVTPLTPTPDPPSTGGPGPSSAPS